jgi:hypothetical protein
VISLFRLCALPGWYELYEMMNSRYGYFYSTMDSYIAGHLYIVSKGSGDAQVRIAAIPIAVYNALEIETGGTSSSFPPSSVRI